MWLVGTVYNFHEKAHFVKANVVADCSDLRALPVVMLPSALSL